MKSKISYYKIGIEIKGEIKMEVVITVLSIMAIIVPSILILFCISCLTHYSTKDPRLSEKRLISL